MYLLSGGEVPNGLFGILEDSEHFLYNGTLLFRRADGGELSTEPYLGTELSYVSYVSIVSFTIFSETGIRIGSVNFEVELELVFLP